MAIAGPPISARPQGATASSRRASEGIARAKGKTVKTKNKRKSKKGKKKAPKKKAPKKKAPKKKAPKKRSKKRRAKKKAAKKATAAPAAPKKKRARRRRKGQKGPNVISHKDGTGLGKGRVKCPAGKTAVATVAKHRKTGTYVFYGRCV